MAGPNRGGAKPSLCGARSGRPSTDHPTGPSTKAAGEGASGGERSSLRFAGLPSSTRDMRVAECYVSNSATAVDVVQETWVAIVRVADAIVGGVFLRTWIYRVLISRARSAGMAEGRTVAVEDMPAAEVADVRPGVPSSRCHHAVHPTRPLQWKSPPGPWKADTEPQLVSSETTVDLVSGGHQRVPTGPEVGHPPPGRRVLGLNGGLWRPWVVGAGSAGASPPGTPRSAAAPRGSLRTVRVFPPDRCNDSVVAADSNPWRRR